VEEMKASREAFRSKLAEQIHHLIGTTPQMVEDVNDMGRMQWVVYHA
jgi:hypothetical protein